LKKKITVIKLFIFKFSFHSETVQQKEMLDELARQEYDVGIAELYDPCSAALMHRIGVRTTLAASAVPLVQMIARRFGIPGFASFMPNLFGSSMSSNYNICAFSSLLPS
jgi:hypothetical protein